EDQESNYLVGRISPILIKSRENYRSPLNFSEYVVIEYIQVISRRHDQGDEDQIREIAENRRNEELGNRLGDLVQTIPHKGSCLREERKHRIEVDCKNQEKND